MWPFYSTMRNITFHKNVYVKTLSTTSPVKLLKFKPSIITATLAHPKWTIPFFGANKDSQTYITKPFIKKMKYNIKIYISEKNRFSASKITSKKLRKLCNIKIYVEKIAKVTTSRFTWTKENANFTTSKFTWAKKPAKFATSNFTWAKKRQIHNTKIYLLLLFQCPSALFVAVNGNMCFLDGKKCQC